MNDMAEVARLLDILGNRNRRRIIELLRQKPCFVTEISDTLVLSPKAVIDHLQMMEREEILSCEMDDRRRKYYYLAHDIQVDVSLSEFKGERPEPAVDRQADAQLKKTVAMLARMIRAHDRILESLEQVNHDIETKITDLAHIHKDLFKSDRELSVIIALSHQSLTLSELEEATGMERTGLVGILAGFEDRGIVKQEKERYMLRGIHAE